METIWKFPIPMQHAFEFKMPAGAHALAVQLQGDTPTLWARVESDAPRETYRFFIVGTGRAVPERAGNYVGPGSKTDTYGIFLKAGADSMDDIWAKEALIRDLNVVFDKHLAGGHKQWCRKYERPGEECSCGGDGLAKLITELRGRLQS